jgi:multisubunit Na+/H+ antiporter MnhB subunit
VLDLRLLFVVIAVAGLVVTIATQWKQLARPDGQSGRRMLSPQMLGIALVMLAVILLMLLAILASLGMLPGFEPMA